MKIKVRKENSSDLIYSGAKSNNKGYVSAAFTHAILFGIVILGVSIILLNSRPIVESATGSISLKNAENIMNVIDNAIREVAEEGVNSSRLITFSTPDEFRIIDDEDAVEFRTTASSQAVIDHFSRTIRNNLAFIGGGDVSCREQDINNDGTRDFIVENSFLKAGFQKVVKTMPLSPVDTSYTIIQITEKSDNTIISFANSSVVIDNNLSTAIGTGFSEILMAGDALPECTVHFFVNSTPMYDIYYKLYAGADFFTMEVRNIR